MRLRNNQKLTAEQKKAYYIGLFWVIGVLILAILIPFNHFRANAQVLFNSEGDGNTPVLVHQSTDPLDVPVRNAFVVPYTATYDPFLGTASGGVSLSEGVEYVRVFFDDPNDCLAYPNTRITIYNNDFSEVAEYTNPSLKSNGACDFTLLWPSVPIEQATVVFLNVGNLNQFYLRGDIMSNSRAVLYDPYVPEYYTGTGIFIALCGSLGCDDVEPEENNGGGGDPVGEVFVEIWEPQNNTTISSNLAVISGIWGSEVAFNGNMLLEFEIENIDLNTTQTINQLNFNVFSNQGNYSFETVLDPETQYRVRACIHTDEGCSGTSDWVNFTTGEQEILPENIATQSCDYNLEINVVGTFTADLSGLVNIPCRIAVFLFVPSKGSLDIFNNLSGIVASKPPFSVFIEIRNMLEIDTDASPAFSIMILDVVKDNVFDDLRVLLSAVIYGGGVIWLFNRSKRLDI